MNKTKSHPKYKYAQVLKEECEKKYYLLGFIAADAWISKKSNRCEITLKEDDVKFLEYIKNMIVPQKQLKYKEKQKAYRLTIDSAEFVEYIYKYFDCNNKTHSLTYPPTIPLKFQKDFIRGYMDGDGIIDLTKHYKRINGQVNIIGGSIRLRILGTTGFLYGLNDVLRFNEIVNFNAKPQKKKDENIYYLCWSGASAERILDWLYSESKSFYLPRKKAVYLEIKHSDSQTLMNAVLSDKTDYNTQMSLKFKDKDIVEAFVLTNS